MRLTSARGGALLATANESEAVIVVVASGYPRGLFQFTGPPTLKVTRQQKQVSIPYLYTSYLFIATTSDF